MKRLIVVLVMLLLCLPKAEACVGKVLYIGVINSSEGQVLAEILSTIIRERTGTTVYTRVYKSSHDLYEDVKGKQVDIFVENTAKALQVLHRAADPNMKRAYDTAKLSYEREKGLIWLKPFGFINGQGAEVQAYTAPVMKVEVLTDFPALPRVIEKLASAINDETYVKLVKSVESGEKPQKVARDFLKSKKLI